MRQHKAICAAGGFKVVGVWQAGGGWCDHTGVGGGRRYASTEIPGRKTVRSNFGFQQNNVSGCGTAVVLRFKKMEGRRGVGRGG